METYLEPGGVGVNQFHLIFGGHPGPVAPVSPAVTAGVDGGPPQVLRQLKVSTGHFTDFVVLTPGQWRFHVTATFGRSPPCRSRSPVRSPDRTHRFPVTGRRRRLGRTVSPRPSTPG